MIRKSPLAALVPPVVVSYSSLDEKINTKIPVFLIHGKKDGVVPLKLSKKIFSIFPKAKKKMEIVKGGDHSLSRKGDLKKLANLIDEIIY